MKSEWQWMINHNKQSKIAKAKMVIKELTGEEEE
jgi:hypothetical protein